MAQLKMTFVTVVIIIFTLIIYVVMQYLIRNPWKLGIEYNKAQGSQQKMVFNHLIENRNASHDLNHTQISDFIQTRLLLLQNPSNCSAARKLVHRLDDRCGFGCTIHWVLYALAVAYRTQRTLVLSNTDIWEGGWSRYFIPLSNTCVSLSEETSGNWRSADKIEPQLVDFAYHDSAVHYRSYIKTVPPDMVHHIAKFHNKPHEWWLGQLMKYILRLNPLMHEELTYKAMSINFSHPVVGVHVRRTDKLIREAKKFELQEYMQHVSDYYRNHTTIGKPKTLLVSDEKGVFEEARQKYPNYELITTGVNTTTSKKLRTSNHSLLGIIEDIYLLSECDYIVCTFSSNVCRLAYELMQQRRRDASQQYFSLDKGYHLAGV